MNQKLKIASGVISLGLLVALIYKLTKVSGGLILSGLFLGGLVIVMILGGSFLLTWLVSLISKRIPFWTIFFTLTAISFGFFHYQIYSPRLKLVVPENYIGEVNLVKSKLKENILTLDSNGIGYLNDWTFNKLHSKPIVVDENGKDLSAQCVGFNNSNFYALGTSSSFENELKIRSLSFEIVPIDKIGKKQRYRSDLNRWVDKEKIE